MSTRQQADKHYATQRMIALAATAQVAALVKQGAGLAAVVARLSAWQLVAALTASKAVAQQIGTDPALIPAPIVGRTAFGFPLEWPLARLIRQHEQAVEAQVQADIDRETKRILRLIESEVIDAGRAGSAVELGVNRSGWVRVLRLPSCHRCVILAGRHYRWSDGFERHPLCDCEHVAATREQARDEGLMVDPVAAFEQGMVRGLSQADTQAILDGADISQVVNARQGMATASIFGRDGVAVTNAARRKYGQGPRDSVFRLRPESIYDLATSHADAMRLLKLYGYIP